MSDTRAAIDSVNDRFMNLFARRDAAGVAALYTEGGRLLPPNGDVVTGRAGIEGFWRGAMAMGIASAGLETVELDDLGATAIEIGRYTLVAADGESLDHGKYLVVWKRDGDDWRLHRDMWNSSDPR